MSAAILCFGFFAFRRRPVVCAVSFCLYSTEYLNKTNGWLAVVCHKPLLWHPDPCHKTMGSLFLLHFWGAVHFCIYESIYLLPVPTNQLPKDLILILISVWSVLKLMWNVCFFGHYQQKQTLQAQQLLRARYWQMVVEDVDLFKRHFWQNWADYDMFLKGLPHPKIWCTNCKFALNCKEATANLW